MSINRDHNRETVLQHIRSAHYHPGVGTNNSSPALSVSSTGLTSGGQMAMGEAGNALLPPPAPAGLLSGGGSSSTSTAPAFRCGVCNQVSNWKHVIQVFLLSFSLKTSNFFFPILLTPWIGIERLCPCFSFAEHFSFSFSLGRSHLNRIRLIFWFFFQLLTAPLPFETQWQHSSHWKSSDGWRRTGIESWRWRFISFASQWQERKENGQERKPSTRRRFYGFVYL